MKRILFGGIVLLFAVAPAFGQSAEQKQATIAYLQKLQNKDGGFRPSAAVEKSSLRATSSALRALKYFGGDVPDRAAAAEFIKTCHDKATGGFADAPGGKPDVAITSVGIMAVVEAKLPTEPYEAGVIKYLGENVKTFEDIRIAVAGMEAISKKAPENEKWLAQVDKEFPRFAIQGRGAARTAGSVLVAQMRMGVNPSREVKLRAITAMLNGQLKDGGFGKADGLTSDLETSYRVMRCYHMLKEKLNDVAKLRDFIAKCRNDDGGYGVAPGEKSAIGSTYFAAIILHWLDEK